MAGGLAALLDDIAAMARLAAASVDDVAAAAGRASAKAAGVVVDDAAVTPRYVTGFNPARELPMIQKIAVGSLRNKLLFILPLALALSQWAPWVLTPLLMVGGTYLCFEGAEKLWEKVSGHDKHAPVTPAPLQGGDHEKTMVASAIRTDFILSAEIMVIALNEVADETFWSRLIILVVVGIAITIGVYGVVALIVKMDDIGLHLIENGRGFGRRLGDGLVKGMPIVLTALSWIGMIAMLWVGGHILLVGVDELGWHAPYGFVHHLEEQVAHATGALGGFLGWLTNTFFSFLAGLAVGAVIVAVMHLIPRRGGTHAADPHPTASDLADGAGHPNGAAHPDGTGHP
nr:DUF808 domain-containing protein [Propioniciclava soli]